MAAVCLMMQFATMDRAKYDDVMKVLDWKNAGSPKGLISHMAGQRAKAGASWMFGNHKRILIAFLRRAWSTHLNGSEQECRRCK